MIDSHTHLAFCDPPDAELVAAAAEAGVRRMVTVGTTGASCREALQSAEDFPQVFAAVGRHPNEAQGFDDADLAELEALAAHPRCVAIGETGLDYYRDHAPRADQARAFAAQIELARRVDKPLIIHTREAQDDTLAMLRDHAGGLRVILHCFTMADRIEECLAQETWSDLVRRQRHLPQGDRAAGGRAPGPRRPPAGGDRRPFLWPQPVRGKPNQPANVVQTARALAVERRVGYEELEAAVESSAAAVFGW